MHRRIIVAAVVFAAFIFAMAFAVPSAAAAKKSGAASKPAAKKPAEKPKLKIIAYYFHGTARCATCRNLEAYSEEAIKNGFEKELKSGMLEFKPLNVEEKGNEHFINDYALYTKSLVLVQMNGAKQVKWKNLDKIWDLVKDKDAYVKYVNDEMKAFIGEAAKGGKTAPAKGKK